MLSLALATCVLGACATLDMPTPIKKVRTTNVTAPSFEYHPPPQKPKEEPDREPQPPDASREPTKQGASEKKRGERARPSDEPVDGSTLKTAEPVDSTREVPPPPGPGSEGPGRGDPPTTSGEDGDVATPRRER